MSKKIFLGVAVIGMLAIALTATKCQAASIAGGNSMDNAVELKAGVYTGGAINDSSTQYFYITLGQGQQVTAKVLFTTGAQYGTMSTLTLYNQDRNEVVNKFEANYSTATLTASWLVNGDQPTYKYYLKLASDDDGISSYNLTLTIDNKYDVASNQDAPTTFDKALSITEGATKGYLAGGTEAGNDNTDMFVFTPSVTGSYAIVVTPPTDAQLGVTVYDANRQEVDSKIGNNAGSIVTSIVQGTKDAKMYVKVGCDYYCSSTLTEYQLAIIPSTTNNTNGGTALVNQNANTAADANTNSVTVTANTNANSNTATTATDDTKKSSTTMYLIIGGALVLVVVIVVVVMAAKKKKPNTPAQQPPVAKQ